MFAKKQRALEERSKVGIKSLRQRMKNLQKCVKNNKDFSPSITCTSTPDINPEQKNDFGFNECNSSSISNHSLYTQEYISDDTVVESK
ncbi:hypothetical protein QTP88_020141 [Uroleucon formosanum]